LKRRKKKKKRKEQPCPLCHIKKGEKGKKRRNWSVFSTLLGRRERKKRRRRRIVGSSLRLTKKEKRRENQAFHSLVTYYPIDLHSKEKKKKREGGRRYRGGLRRLKKKKKREGTSRLYSQTIELWRTTSGDEKKKKGLVWYDPTIGKEKKGKERRGKGEDVFAILPSFKSAGFQERRGGKREKKNIRELEKK